MPRENGVAVTIRVIGVLEIIAGIIIGYATGYEQSYYSYGEMNWITFFTWVGVAAVTGTLTIGFAEIIKLLAEINFKLNKDDNSESDQENQEELEENNSN
ncbi:hypothetical protein MUB24_22085 [Lederbergia sp. NSJ-179]|uniref:hypothetical protein n=1 Tax=Lederbergia sp. NSJ-179 TaxID=2931402 RepID=UPI001FD3CC34|nr:hypothetical protein [Lederbergia sp. NSJ-179]MCJ7843514.1 hypothetical protein [Lederbergia sp. NSJ-179]